jgi:hypothetical protein
MFAERASRAALVMNTSRYWSPGLRSGGVVTIWAFAEVATSARMTPNNGNVISLFISESPWLQQAPAAPPRLLFFASTMGKREIWSDAPIYLKISSSDRENC